MQIVVANDLCTADGLLQVSVLQASEHLVVVVGPYSGIEVSQKLQAYADLVGILLVESRHLLMRLPECAQQVFHMMPHLVGNDVCVCEITVSPKLLLHG